MGREGRHERERKRSSYASKIADQKRRHMMITVAVLAGIGAIVAYSAYNFINIDPQEISGAPLGAGPLNSAHTHTAILVKIFDDTFPFHEIGYQVESPWIHFENHDGGTIHKHAAGVTLGFLFDSLNIDLTDQCYVFPNGQQYCTNEDYTLKFFINRQQVDDMRGYEPMEEDRILVVYGAETPEEIDVLLAELDNLEIVR